MNHLPRRLSLPALLMAAAAATLVLTAGIARAQSYWFEDYERAVDLIDEGRMAEASALLSRLIQEHPLPQSGVRVPGDRFIDYLPYYQQARIQLHQGDTAAASQSLDVCEAFGAIKQNRRAAKQLIELRRQIAAKESARTARATSSGAPTPHATVP